MDYVTQRPFEQIEEDLQAGVNRSLDVSIPYTTGESAAAAFELGKLDTSTNSVMRLYDMNKLKEREEGKKMLSAQEANDLYPFLETPFAKDTPAAVAAEIADRQFKRLRLQQAMNQGPDTNLSKGLNFAAAMAPHAMDPLDIAAGFLLTGGLGMAGKAMYNAGKLKKTIDFSRRAMSAPLLKDFSVNLAGNVVNEAFVLNANKSEQMDYQMSDAFENAVMGAMAGTALFQGARLGKLGVQKAMKKLGYQRFEQGQIATIGQLAEGKAPRSNILFDDVYTTSKVNPDSAPYKGYSKATGELSLPKQYEFKRITNADISSAKFFATQSVRSSVDSGNVKVVSTDFGDGFYLTDNPNIANAVSTPKGSTQPGSFREVSLQDARLLDADSAYTGLTPADQKSIKKALESAIGKEQAGRLLQDGPSLKSLQRTMESNINKELIPEDALTKFNDGMKKEVDGYFHTSDEASPSGIKEDPSNVVFLFEGKKIGETENIYYSDVNAQGALDQNQMTKEMTDYHTGRESDYFHDESFKQFDESVPKTRNDGLKVDEVIAREQEMEIEAQELVKQGLMNEDTLNNLREVRALHEAEEGLMMKAIKCAENGI